MNAKQRNQNRETAQNLRYAIARWDSRNRRFVIERFKMVETWHYMPRLIAVPVKAV